MDAFLFYSLIVSSCNVDSLADDDCLKISGNVDDNTEDDDGEHEGEHSVGNVGSSIVLLVQVRIADSCVPDNNCYHISMLANIFKPLKSNDNGCVDGAAEGDVVDRVDHLRQDIGIDRAILG